MHMRLFFMDSKVVGSMPYNENECVLDKIIKFIGDLWQEGDFLGVLQFSPSIQLTVTI